MSCCPKSAWGELKNPDYKEKGTVEKVRLVKDIHENLFDDELHVFKILQKQAFALNGKNLSFSRGIRKIHRPHRPQTQYTDLLFSNYFLALGKYTDLLGKYTDTTNHQIKHILF